jgi:hypothetical protein
MKVRVVVLALVVLCLGGAMAWAFPTTDGSSGIVTLPTAQVTPASNVEAAIDYMKVGGETSWPMRANLGLGNKAELWAGYNRFGANILATDEFVDEENATMKLWNVGAKYMLLSQPKTAFALAVGGSFGKAKNGDSVDITKAFIVASKNLNLKPWGSQPMQVKGSVGVMYEKVGDPFSESITAPYLGVECMIRKGANLGLEYRFKDSSLDNKAVLSAVLRMPVSETQPLWIEVGTTNGTTGLGIDSQKMFVGVGYRFDMNIKGRQTGERTKEWGY